MNAMYVDKLDGIVDTAFFEKMSTPVARRAEICACAKSRGIDRNAQRLFANQEPREKRRLLNFVLSNCTWENGDMVATFRQPFDMLADTAHAAARYAANETAKSAKS